MRLAHNALPPWSTGRARLASMSWLPAANDPQTSAAAIRVQAIAPWSASRQAVAAGCGYTPEEIVRNAASRHGHITVLSFTAERAAIQPRLV